MFGQAYFSKMEQLTKIVTRQETDTTIAEALEIIKSGVDPFMQNPFTLQSAIDTAAAQGNFRMFEALLTTSSPSLSSALIGMSEMYPASTLFWMCDCSDLNKRHTLLELFKRPASMSDAMRKSMTYVQVHQHIYDGHIRAALGEPDPNYVDGEDEFGLMMLDYYMLSGYEYSGNKKFLKGYDVNRKLTKGPFAGLSMAWILAYGGKFEVLQEILKINPKSILSLDMQAAVQNENMVCAGADIALLCLYFEKFDFLIFLLEKGVKINPLASYLCKSSSSYQKNFIDKLMVIKNPKTIINILKAMAKNPDHFKDFDLDQETSNGYLTAMLICHNEWELLKQLIEKTTASISQNTMIYYNDSGHHIYPSLVAQLAKCEKWDILRSLLDKNKNHIVDLSLKVDKFRNLEKILSKNKEVLDEIKNRNKKLKENKNPTNSNNGTSQATGKKNKLQKTLSDVITTPTMLEPKVEPVVALTPEEELNNQIATITNKRITLTITKGKSEDVFTFTATEDTTITNPEAKKEAAKTRKEDIKNLVGLLKQEKMKIDETGAFHVKVKAKMKWITSAFINNTKFAGSVQQKFLPLPSTTIEPSNCNDDPSNNNNSTNSAPNIFVLNQEHKNAWQDSLLTLCPNLEVNGDNDILEITPTSVDMWSVLANQRKWCTEKQQYHVTEKFIEEEVLRRIQRFLVNNKLADVEISQKPLKLVIKPKGPITDISELKQEINFQITSRPVVLTPEENDAWQKALLDAICSANGILIEATFPDTFVLTITQDPVWSVRGPDERHDKTDQFQVTRNSSYSIVADEIFPRIKRYLESNKFAEVEHDKMLFRLIIKPLQPNVDVRELQDQIYFQIRKTPQIITPSTNPTTVTPDETTSVVGINRKETSEVENTGVNNNDVIDYLYLTKKLLNNIGFGTNADEKSFYNLDSTQRILKGGRKCEFVWDFKAYPTISQFSAAHFFATIKAVVEPIAPGLIDIHPTNDGIKIVITSKGSEFASLQANMEGLHAAFITKMDTLKQQRAAESKALVMLEPLTNDKNADITPEPTPIVTPASESIAVTIRRNILRLDKTQRDNFSGHLKQLLDIPPPNSDISHQAHFHAYLLYGLRLFEILSRVYKAHASNNAENIFDYWRNFIRHEYDKHDWKTFYALIHESFKVMKSIDDKTPLPTTGNVTFFMPISELEKDIVTQLDVAIEPYKEKLKQKQLGKDKQSKQSKKQAQPQHEALLAALTSGDLPAHWKRDAILMTTALIGETNTMEPYKDIYIQIGHYGFDKPYDIFADELYQKLMVNPSQNNNCNS